MAAVRSARADHLQRTVRVRGAGAVEQPAHHGAVPSAACQAGGAHDAPLVRQHNSLPVVDLVASDRHQSLPHKGISSQTARCAQNVAQKLLAAEATAGSGIVSNAPRSGGAAAEAAYINDAEVSSG